jgi:hypothetical protein
LQSLEFSVVEKKVLSEKNVINDSFSKVSPKNISDEFNHNSELSTKSGDDSQFSLLINDIFDMMKSVYPLEGDDYLNRDFLHQILEVKKGNRKTIGNSKVVPSSCSNYSQEMIYLSKVDVCFVETLHLLLSKCHPISAFPLCSSSLLSLSTFSYPNMMSDDYGFGGLPHFLSLICSALLLSFSMISLSDLKRLVCRDALIFLAVRWKRAVDLSNIQSSSPFVPCSSNSFSFTNNFPLSCSLTGSLLLDKYVLLLLSFSPTVLLNTLLGDFMKDYYGSSYFGKFEKNKFSYKFDFVHDYFSLFSPFFYTSLSTLSLLDESLSFLHFTQNQPKQHQCYQQKPLSIHHSPSPSPSVSSNIYSFPPKILSPSSSLYNTINLSSHNSSISLQLFSICINQQYDKYTPILQKCLFIYINT